ncbi:MAG: hypothetical protein MZV65_49275 [Chromatiales bacterium]|nr:hypothetical protein [Chromatiales bacterium]
MTELGTEFGAHLMVDGNWNHIVKLENALDLLAGRYKLKIATLRSKGSRKTMKVWCPTPWTSSPVIRSTIFTNWSHFFTAAMSRYST